MLEMNECLTRFKLDTGAEVTAISETTFNRLQQPQLTNSQKKLYGPSKQQRKCIGEFAARIKHQDRITTQKVFVVKDLKINMLGLPAICALNLVTRIDATVMDSTIDYKKKFPALFKGLGDLGDPFEIQLIAGTIPHCIYTP